MHRKKMKLALVESEKTHWQAALDSNERLPIEFRLTEHDITRLVTGRKTPLPEQAEALAAVLGVPAAELFQELAVDGAKPNRCSRCGQFCGNQWGATGSGRMSKRADSLLCERCTRKSILPDGGEQS